MRTFNTTNIPMTDRIKKLKEELYRKMPEIEVDRAVLITESYQQTEQLPTVKRRALAFEHILNNHGPVRVTIVYDRSVVA